jgi:dTDP-3-amino-3,4,6-trideoxy-alpha-D-glucopyranose N,N-dimethyltransferase/N-dimethyltransferase
LLGQARRRLRGVSLHAVDLRNVALPRRCDVVTRLFSAVGQVPHLRDLHRAVDRMAAHPEPGGVLAVEPWLRRALWEVGRVSIQTSAEPGRAVARMTVSDIEGEVAVMDMHHLVGTPTGVEHVVERHRLTLFRHEEYLAAFEAAGTAGHHEAHGVSGRGAYMGVGTTTGSTGEIA